MVVKFYTTMNKKILIVSGGFDPIHIGHIRYFKEAKSLGDYLVVILNSDDFLINKKGYKVMPFEERKEILESIKYVDYVISCKDKDNSVCETLRKFKEEFKEYYLIFANGGDRNAENTLEKKVCEELGIELIYNVGGKKIQSSSELVNNIKEKEKR